MERNSGNERAFSVVQFVELPFEGIDDYVCVPYSWLIVPKATGQKTVVAYPKDEDPVVTRDRVMRQERYNDEWKFYLATVKYESDTYRDAEYWISKRNVIGPLVEKELKVTVKEPWYSLSKKLRSANQNPLSKSNIPDSGSPLTNFRPQIDNVRSLANVHDDHKLLVNEVSSKVPIPEPVEKIIRPMKIERNLANAQNPSNLIEQTRSLSTRSVEQPPVVTQNQSQNDPQVPKMHTGNSRDQTASLRSIKISSQDIQVPRINIERSNDVAAVDPSDVLHSVTNVAETSQQLPSSSHKCPSYVRQSDGHPPAHEQYYTTIQYLLTNQGKFMQELLKGSIEDNSYDHRTTSRTTEMRIPSIRQNLTHLSNPMSQTSELPQQRQPQPNQQDSQRQPQKIPIGISNEPKRKRKMPTLQGVKKKIPPLIPSNVLKSIRQQRLQPRLNAQSTEDNNIDLTTSPQNIAATATSEKQNSEIPNRSFYQSTRIQHTTAHENTYQNQRTQEQLVDQCTRTNSTTKRVHFIDDVARSPVTGSHLNVIDNACQTDEYMVEETLPPYYTVTLDNSDAVSDHEMSTDKTPVEPTNNFDCTANDFGCSSVDRPTAAQNPMSTNHQTHPRVRLEQQMLDNFAILFRKMSVTLRYTCDMNNNLWSKMRDIAETYKILLGAVEQFNAAGNAMQSSEERHTEVTASASSSNQNQHSK